jgi:hypothetical protein
MVKTLICRYCTIARGVSHSIIAFIAIGWQTIYRRISVNAKGINKKAGTPSGINDPRPVVSIYNIMPK